MEVEIQGDKLNKIIDKMLEMEMTPEEQMMSLIYILASFVVTGNVQIAGAFQMLMNSVHDQHQSIAKGILLTYKPVKPGTPVN